ncbi:DUF4332 domain-containing protein [Lacipirellula limnantheis]|uniref:Chromosome partition protein Smc n=1 Tax=Lacipirellula limnantheis TaxID=2528024 RepID=A0A517TWM3_9BACT|nr:DUF4332 domain-containing protein [Lacipirellula limnantheis]QDT72776.1 Chromosome partition protein Smc [Lacipirellula limnantheis]
MNVTQLRLAGQGAWPELVVDRFAPDLNVFFGGPRTGKSTVAQLAAQLLYGKHDSAWRRQFGQSTPLAEGSLEVDGPRGRYTLRRHRDGSPYGRLSIATAGGPAVDSGTVRSLLAGVSPRLVAELYAVDFAQPPRAATLLDGEFAREFTLALHPQQSAHDSPDGVVCRAHAAAPRTAFDRRRVDELVARRDAVVKQIEEEMSASRRESNTLHKDLVSVEATLADRRRQAEQLQLKLRTAEAKLAEIEARLRYFALETAVRRGPEIDAEKHRRELEQLDAEIGRCRQTLSDLQAREATVRRELAEVHPDGTADSASSLADQRVTVGVLERLLDDLDAEVSQLARSHEPGRCVGCDAHARMSPVAQMLRQQLYALCGQVTEQERAVRRVELNAESRQLSRAQSDLSEQLEHLLHRRQAHVHAAQLSYRPAVALPQSPAAAHCQCQGHAEFVRDADAMLLARTDRPRYEADARQRRNEAEHEMNELRGACDALQREIKSLEGRWQILQQGRAQTTVRSTLDQLRAELQQLESDIQRAIHASDSTATLHAPLASDHRRPWRASDTLAQLTDGQLVQIRMDREGRGATVIDREGRVLTLAELSPAQQDQLYLALTLALVSSFAARSIDLPLFLDEPFLRQDARGVAAMAGVLHEFARQGRQLIVLTEDREAARRFESLGDEVRDLDELRRGARAAAPPSPAPIVVELTPEPAAAATVKIVRETVGERKPQLRIAGEWSPDDDEQDVFFLSRTGSIADFPVLGNDTAKIFAELNITTVEDLLAADANEVALRLARPGLTADAVRLWQTHMSLMCFVPGVSLNDAQVLAANEIGSPEALFAVDVRLLSEAIDQFLASDRGRRFAALRTRYTRDELAETQKLARTQRENWLLAKKKYGWVDRPSLLPAGPRPTASTVSAKSERPAAVGARTSKGQAAKRDASSKGPVQFHLQRSSPVVDAPSIGPIAAERLAGVGIRTVADLLNASPESTAQELGEAKVTAGVITRWQREARLVCRIPELRGVGAQLLVASGFHEAEQVAGAKAEDLVTRVRETCRSAQGQRILRHGNAPSDERIAEWSRNAARMRPLEAA